MGFWELVVISVVALLVLGPDKLPTAIRSVTKFVRSVKQMSQSIKAEVSEELRIHELHENLRKAESQGLDNISPALQKSVDELKAAASAVQQPYRKDDAPQSTPQNEINQTSTPTISSSSTDSAKKNNE
ncbi:Sec-independent protein translocase protein TatB [Flocculibacter collagenilyticus]|uniref:Sec-independent protein translocase protein TatB n=1 Tax=Flocculibacter collagenilyticus TaxID=2744479 RepID=UPI0018F4C9EB|nr:Sec-independent protein translocase protein TatB [Flocculibacter collagenilyticus]